MGKFNDRLMTEFWPPRGWRLGRDLTYTTKDICLLYTSPSPRDRQKSRMPASA